MATSPLVLLAFVGLVVLAVAFADDSKATIHPPAGGHNRADGHKPHDVNVHHHSTTPSSRDVDENEKEESSRLGSSDLDRCVFDTGCPPACTQLCQSSVAPANYGSTTCSCNGGGNFCPYSALCSSLLCTFNSVCPSLCRTACFNNVNPLYYNTTSCSCSSGDPTLCPYSAICSTLFC